jgi:Kef-type K+ transport system membrane component KefB
MGMDARAITLITLGGLFLVGLAADVVGRRTRLPRVTLLLLVGVCAGPIGLDLFPDSTTLWFPFVADLALVMVAFLLGGELTPELLRDHGRAILSISFVVVVVTALCVGAGLLAAGWTLSLALLLGAISTATDPAAVSDVVRETGVSSRFSKTLLGVVAVDDAWGIAAIGLALTVVLGLHSPDAARTAVLHGLFEIFGAILVGCALGIPMALLTGRVREGEPTQSEALGGVLLCGGVAMLLGVSFLLAAMTMGAVVANLARHHTRPFHAIEGIEWPFMVLLFVLSGASLRLTELGAAGGLTAAYIGLRVIGRVAGGWLGAYATGLDGPADRMIGAALLPQAGVAIGMALVVSQRLPEIGGAILSATVAATIVFELLGPIATRLALLRSKDLPRSATPAA